MYLIIQLYEKNETPSLPERFWLPPFLSGEEATCDDDTLPLTEFMLPHWQRPTYFGIKY